MRSPFQKEAFSEVFASQRSVAISQDDGEFKRRGFALLVLDTKVVNNHDTE